MRKSYFLFFALSYPALVASVSRAAENRNAVLIGWDGTRRARLLQLLSDGQLPNLKQLIAQGSLVNTQVTTGNTQTKPGWAEILTGCSAVRLGIPSNKVYEPIPKGFTVFERLKERFGSNNIVTAFIGGKSGNIGDRGPHKICINARTRDPATHRPTNYQDDLRFDGLTEDGGPPQWASRKGEPYFLSAQSIDRYETRLGKAERVGEKALGFLMEHRNARFFAFFHFGEPDNQGHRCGENSTEYAQGIKTDDAWLGRIVAKLKELGIYDKTAIYITTDHGFDPGEFQHDHAPETFLATNSPRKIMDGDRKDVTPTILDGFGIALSGIQPSLDGRSLFAAEIDSASVSAAPLRIGYFLGGRTSLLMRAQQAGDFDRSGITVQLITRKLRDNHFSILAPDELIDLSRKGESLGDQSKATGLELVAGVLDGRWDLASIGESSFLAAVADGQPIVAVAELGHDVKGNSGHLFALRNGVSISNPADYLGKVFVSRRAGPGDAAFLLEYFSRRGVDTARDVLVLDHVPATPEERQALPRDKVLVVYNVFEDDLTDGVVHGMIDGGFFHLRPYETLKRFLKVVEPLHFWTDPELSMAVLVCTRDFLRDQENRRRLKMFLGAYMTRIRYEHSLSPMDRQAALHSRYMTMDSSTPGLNYPQYSDKPTVDASQLYRMIELLQKYHQVSWPKMRLEAAIDNSLIEAAAEASILNAAAKGR